MEARKATVDDIPFIASLGRAAYPMFALEHAEAWLGKIMSIPNAAVFVCDRAVATVSCQSEFWRPNELVADVLPMFGHPSKDNPLGVYKALTAASEWADAMGCYGLRFGSSAGAHSPSGRASADMMETFAKRMGAYPWGLTFMKEYSRCRPQFQ